MPRWWRTPYPDSEEYHPAMTPVLVTMAVVLVVAVLALAYAAYPHRGEPVPGAAWIGDVLERATDAVPTIRDGDLDPEPVGDLDPETVGEPADEPVEKRRSTTDRPPVDAPR